MATVTKATRGAVAGNAWTSPANAVSDNSVYATAAPAKNADVLGDWDFAAFTDAEIPVGSRITQVRLRYQFKVSTTSSVADATFTNVKGGVAGGSVNDATEPTADKDVLVTFTSTPTEADLKTAGLIVARADAHRGNSTTAVTFSLDYVELQVDWSPVDTGQAAQTLPALGQASSARATARATGAQGLPHAGLSSTARVSMSGAAGSALPALSATVAGTLTQPLSGAGAETLPALTQAGHAEVISHGAATSGLQPLGAHAAGSVIVTGSTSGLLGALAQAAGGTLKVSGEGGAITPVPVSLADGAITAPQAPQALTAVIVGMLPAVGEALSGAVTQAGSGAVATVLPAPVSKGAGAVVVVEPDAETIREAVRCLIQLPAMVGAELGIVDEQYAALVKGADVVVTSDQLRGIVHAKCPANLDAHKQWTLSGDSTLTPL